MAARPPTTYPHAQPPRSLLLSLLYFAAMSYTETAWRLEKQHLAEMFLLSSDAPFVRFRKELCARAKAGAPARTVREGKRNANLYFDPSTGETGADRLW